MRQRVTAGALVACIGMLAAPDCSPPPPPEPKVVSFAVSHDHVCAGDSVTVSWKVDDAVALLYSGQSLAEIQAALQDGDPSEFTVDAEGSQAFTITEPITFQLVAYLDEANRPTSEPLAVQLVPAPPLAWTFDPSCPSSPWATWSETAGWTDSAQVVSVENQAVDQRPLEVEHAGKTWTIAAGAESVDPVPVAGPWSLGDGSLKAGEGCPGGSTIMEPGGAPPVPPPPIAVRIDYACP